METWQNLIQIGDKHFHNSVLDEAELAYIRACEHIEKLLPLSRDSAEEVEAAVTCYHSLAECLKCQGRYLTAVEVLLKAHQLMNDGLRQSAHLPKKREAFVEARRKTIIELKYFQWIMRMSRDATTSDANFHPEVILNSDSGPRSAVG